MNNKIVIKNREPQQITINGGGEVIGITTVLVNGIDVTEGSVAYVIVPTKTSELINDSGFLTQETDPTIPYYIKQITQADINRWNNKQEQLVSGVNIKTINENSLLGSGNIDISTSYTAGYGININASNEISNTITSYNDLTDLPTIPTSTSELLNDSDFVTSNELSDVAFSGSYADLSNIPEIPDSTSDLINDSGFITKSVDDLENYYNKDVINETLPNITGSGTIVILNDTVDGGQLKISLSASELTQAGTPTPSSPQDIHTISGSNTIQIKDNNDIVQEEADIDLDTLEYCKIGTYEDEFIKNKGNNMFNGNLTTGYIDLDGTLNTSQNSWKTSSDFIEIEPNKTYIINGTNMGNRLLYAFYNSNETFIYPRNETTPNTSFTSPNDAKYIKFSTNSTTPTNIMLNKGTTALPYEPYGSNEWYIKKNIGKVVLDGEENWVNGQTLTNTMHYNIVDFTTVANGCVIPANDSVLVGLKSNYFEEKTNLYGIDNIGIDLHANKNFILGIEKTTAIDLATFKTWLSTHNTEVYYPLATPTYTQITGNLAEQLENVYKNMTTCSTKTTINQVNEDLGFVINAETITKVTNAILTDYVKNTDYASSSTGGVVKINGYGLQVSNGTLIGLGRTYAEYTSGANQLIISKQTLENVITGKGLISGTNYLVTQDYLETISSIASGGTTTLTYDITKSGYIPIAISGISCGNSAINIYGMRITSSTEAQVSVRNIYTATSTNVGVRIYVLYVKE